ncbi:hypothetical protein MMC30_009035 [Trapelia coarctata]|nr:hypothetical protein [Trapelia coarctata]
MAEPVQFCKYGNSDRPNSVIDFCVGVTAHENATSSQHNLYITFTHTRYQASAAGWTAVGLGSIMDGALMFIIYGDPLSGEDPLVSIRTAVGHHQPRLITPQDFSSGDMRVLRASWMSSGQSKAGAAEDYKAVVSIVCYGCSSWSGTQISTTTSQQPWLWAWNAEQKFDVFTFDAHLDMHKHHAGTGGWGNFYVDMKKSINRGAFAPSFPPIRSNILEFGATETPWSQGGIFRSLAQNQKMHLHALVMLVSFLVLFPSGVFALRSGSPKGFKYHWILQLSASLLFAFGVLLGLLMGRPINTTHQAFGLALAVAIGLQSLLGWKHHIVFLRVRCRTWVSHSHVWLGRFVMIAGLANAVLGMRLRNWSLGLQVALVVVGVLELCALSAWVWLRARQQRFAPDNLGTSGSSQPAWSSIGGYFALGPEDEEDEEKNVS